MNCLMNVDKKIKQVCVENREEGEVIPQNHILVYILKGKACFSYGYYDSGTLDAGYLVFLPLGSHVNYTLSRDSQLLFFLFGRRYSTL